MLKWSMGKDKTKILKISVEAAALDLLRAIQGEVSVISVVGPYRSGKSFLLNQILHDLIDNYPGLHAADLERLWNTATIRIRPSVPESQLKSVRGDG